MKSCEDAQIRLFHVYKRYGAHNALFDISLDIFKNEFLFLAGPSGAYPTIRAMDRPRP